MINLLRWCVRIAWLGALVLGLLSKALNLHMTLGSIVAGGLAIIAVYALVARVRIPLAAIALVWAAATVYVGLNQTRWMVEGNHWIVQIVHVLLGVGAIGLAEVLAGSGHRHVAN